MGLWCEDKWSCGSNLVLLPRRRAEEVQYAEEAAHVEHDREVVAAATLQFFPDDDHEMD